MLKHFMVCISGYSGVGKDECASVLIKDFGGVQTGLADPAKRHMADVYGFSYEQLFGPSKFRNAGDLRYPKNVAKELDLSPCPGGHPLIPEEWHSKSLWSFVINGRKGVSGPLAEILPKLTQVTEDSGTRYFVEEGDPRFWLSPREALQLYCELMNNLYLDTWIEKGINIHRQLGEIYGHDDTDVCYKFWYDRMRGVVPRVASDDKSWQKNTGYFVSCFADFRHWHEIRAAKRVTDMVPVLVRIRSERVPVPPYNHRSETEQSTIPDSEFHFVLENNGTVAEAHDKVREIMNRVITTGIPSGTVTL